MHVLVETPRCFRRDQCLSVSHRWEKGQVTHLYNGSSRRRLLGYLALLGRSGCKEQLHVQNGCVRDHSDMQCQK